MAAYSTGRASCSPQAWVCGHRDGRGTGHGMARNHAVTLCRPDRVSSGLPQWRVQAGRLTMNSAPAPGPSLQAATLPPCNSTRDFTGQSKSGPRALLSRGRAGFCQNRSNTRGSRSGAIPSRCLGHARRLPGFALCCPSNRRLRQHLLHPHRVGTGTAGLDRERTRQRCPARRAGARHAAPWVLVRHAGAVSMPEGESERVVGEGTGEMSVQRKDSGPPLSFQPCPVTPPAAPGWPPAACAGGAGPCASRREIMVVSRWPISTLTVTASSPFSSRLGAEGVAHGGDR